MTFHFINFVNFKGIFYGLKKLHNIKNNLSGVYYSIRQTVGELVLLICSFGRINPINVFFILPRPLSFSKKKKKTSKWWIIWLEYWMWLSACWQSYSFAYRWQRNNTNEIIFLEKTCLHVIVFQAWAEGTFTFKKIRTLLNLFSRDFKKLWMSLDNEISIEIIMYKFIFNVCNFFIWVTK